MSPAASEDVINEGRNSPATAGLLLDAHVHFHPAFHSDAFLTQAATNFARQPQAGALRALALTESKGDNWFASLGDSASFRAGDWSLTELHDEVAEFHHPRLGALCALAGHQVVCAEGLEVLTLGMTRKQADGSPAADVIQQTLDSGGLPVLPWGFGKWLGQRGRVVRELVSMFGTRVTLGDNGGRWRRSPRPALLRAATAEGLAVLPGSDPLPWSGEEATIARRGIWLDGHFAPQTLLADLHRALTTRMDTRRHQEFGDGESTYRFCRNQLLMQWRKRVTA